MNRPQIFLADLLLALHELRIDTPATAREVMRMLSLESWRDVAMASPRMPAVPMRAGASPSRLEGIGALPSPGASAPNSAGVPGAATTDSAPDTATPAGPSASSSAKPPGPAPKAARSARAQAAAPLATAKRLTGPTGAVASRPNWAVPAAALPRAQAYAVGVPDSLFEPMQERSILACLGAATGDDGVVDVDSLVGLLARGEPVVRLPTGCAWNLRRGLQVLVDQGAGMAPFAQDIEPLIARLGQLLSSDRLQRASFDGSPLRGVRRPRSKRGRWQAPLPGTAVLLVTDLGLGGDGGGRPPAGVGEWLEVADIAQRARVHLRTLVPYPPSRWPAVLAGPLRCVHWDRRTTAASTRRALEGGAAWSR